MSVEEAPTKAVDKPVDSNAAAAEDAKKLLAELESEGPTSEVKNGNGAANGESEEKNSGDLDNGDDRNIDRRHPDRADRGDRGDRGDRREGGRGRGRGRGDRGRGGRGRGDFRGGIKSVVTREEKSDDYDAIRKQMEFYFSDSNLPQDKFLFEKVGGHENNPVEISLLRTFKRMRHFEPLDAIIEALRTSTILQLTEDDTMVQRKIPLAEGTKESANFDHVQVYEDKAMPRSVYVKGFGSEVPSTQFDIEAWFAEFGSTNAVRLRRADDKTFKGSVFAEFETEEQAKAFLERDPKPKYNDKTMQIMSKKDYCEKKVDDIKAGKIRPHDERSSGARDDRRGRGRGDRGDRGSNRGRRGDNDDRDWRTRRDEDKKNGFRDNKGRGDRDRQGRGGRERQRSTEKDDRGVPVIKTAPETEREKNKADALAKAKAAVEASKSEQTPSTAPADVEGSKKREREDGAGTDEPAAKKADLKADA